MKLTTSICTLFAICVGSAMYSAAATLTFTRNFNIPEPVIEERTDPDGNLYQEIRFDGYLENEEYGSPSLGWETITVELPYGATDLTTEVSFYTGKRELTLDKTLWPCQRPIETSLNHNWEFTGLDQSAYSSSSSLPLVKLIGDGLIAGKKHVVTVAIRPFGYDFSRNILLSYSSVSFTVSYKLDLTSAPIASSGITITDVAKTLMSNAVTSGFELCPSKQVIANAISQTALGFYYIIVPESLKEAVGKLALWKSLKGYDVTVKVVEEVLSDSTFKVGNTFSFNNRSEEIVDEAASLRAYLQSEFQKKGSFYCLLIGNSETSMPIRRIHLSEGYSEYYQNPEGDAFVPTDNYFSDLTTNWLLEKYNDAEHFSGYKSTQYYPDIVVGRLLCAKPEDIERYTRKLICYESNPGNGDNEYLQNAFYFEQDQITYYPSNEKDENGDYILIPHNTGMLGEADRVLKKFNPFGTEHTLIVKDLCLKGNDFGESAPHYSHNGADIISYMGGAGFISAHGRGCPSVISTCYDRHYIAASDQYDKEQLQVSLRNNDSECGMNRLENSNKPSVMYSISCINAPFDNFTYEDIVQTDEDGVVVSRTKGHCFNLPYNLASAFTVSSDNGGVAYLGNSREGFRGTSADMEADFGSFLLSVRKIGIAEALSKKYFYGSLIRNGHNLIGDPEFEMWLSMPMNLNISDSLANGKVTVRNNPGIEASVHLVNWMNNIFQKEDFNNQIEFESGEISVSVWKSGFLPFIKYYAIDGILNNQSRLVISKEAILGCGVKDKMFAIGDNGALSVECSGDVVLNEGLVIQNGGSLEIKTEGRCFINGFNLMEGGCLEISASEIIVKGPFKASKQSKLTLNSNLNK